MMRGPLAGASVVPAAAGVLVPRARKDHPMRSGFLSRTVSHKGASFLFSIFLPASGSDAGVSLPTILYLHGKGRGGRDGSLQTEGGLGGAIREVGDSFPFLVAFPQSPDDSEFMGDTAELCLAALDATASEFNGDSRRTYLVGGSMGGHGAYHLAQLQRDRWAGLVVTCASPRLPEWRLSEVGLPSPGHSAEPFLTTALGLAGLPTWIFHGAEDQTVPVSEARELVAAFDSVGSPVRYTEYPGVGHGSCSRAFREPGLWSWLLAQTREVTGSAS